MSYSGVSDVALQTGLRLRAFSFDQPSVMFQGSVIFFFFFLSQNNTRTAFNTHVFIVWKTKTMHHCEIEKIFTGQGDWKSLVLMMKTKDVCLVPKVASSSGRENTHESKVAKWNQTRAERHISAHCYDTNMIIFCVSNYKLWWYFNDGSSW